MDDSLRNLIRSLRDGNLEEVKEFYQRNPDSINDELDLSSDTEFVSYLQQYK